MNNPTSYFQDILLQFQINNLPLTSLLQFCQYCDRRLTFENPTYIHKKAANFAVLKLFNFYFTANSSQQVNKKYVNKHFFIEQTMHNKPVELIVDWL